MEQPDPRCNEYASKAGNPSSMGGHGQPTGRPTKPDEGRDSNHPYGSKAGATTGKPSREQPGTPGY